MNPFKYLCLLISHNAYVLRYNVSYIFHAFHAVFYKLKQTVFVLTGQGNIGQYQKKTLTKNLAEIRDMSPLPSRSEMSDYIFIQKMLGSTKLNQLQIVSINIWTSPDMYRYFAFKPTFIDRCVRFRGIQTGKELVDFIAETSGVSSQTLKYHLQEDVFTKIYSDKKIEELYSIFDPASESI